MKFYGLSKQALRRLISKPYRVETGVAPDTIALMKPVIRKLKLKNKKRKEKSKWQEEIWLMFQKDGNGIKVISAWRYPGVSPISNPIPEEIINEALLNIN